MSLFKHEIQNENGRIKSTLGYSSTPDGLKQEDWMRQIKQPQFNQPIVAELGMQDIRKVVQIRDVVHSEGSLLSL